MNLWSIHPKYLDKQGLIVLWREALQAQKELAEEADLKTANPLLQEFQKNSNPVKAIGSYLSMIASEGARQGYKLNHEKILCPNFDSEFIKAKEEQVIFEMDFLKEKLKMRDVQKYKELKKAKIVEMNPVFDNVKFVPQKFHS